MINKYMKYLICLVLSLVIYIIYLLIKKEKDKIKIIKNLVLIITIITYLYILFSYRGRFIYNLSYEKIIFLAFSLGLLFYTYGLIKNNKEVYEKNINYYLFIVIILLITITFFIGRVEIDFSFDNLKYISSNNLIPFRSIKNYLTHPVSFRRKIYNLGGNFILLIPLAFIFMLKNSQYKKILKQLKIMIPLTILIELLQVLTGTGSLDIDDIILNLLGVISFTFLITRFNIIDYLKKVFYKDYLKSKKLKYILFVIAIIYPIVYVIEAIIITLKYL